MQFDAQELANDPAFYAYDIESAVTDMAENCSREDFMAAIADILERHAIKIVELREFRRAA